MKEDTVQTRRVNPLAALRAVRKVINDPEQTQEVFRVLHALSGPSLRRNYRRFKQSANGAKILEEQRILTDLLNNTEYLSSLSTNSLGNTYHRFITQEQISAGGLEEANMQAGGDELKGNFGLFVSRTRASHDLFHVLTQYGRDPLGEACLLAFTYGQTGNIAFVFILAFASIRLYKGAGGAVFPALWRAYRDGKKATWLLNTDWETVLEMPLEQVRSQFSISQPKRYEILLAQLATE